MKLFEEGRGVEGGIRVRDGGRWERLKGGVWREAETFGEPPSGGFVTFEDGGGCCERGFAACGVEYAPGENEGAPGGCHCEIWNERGWWELLNCWFRGGHKPQLCPDVVDVGRFGVEEK